MSNVKKKSRKNLYGLIVENLEDTSKKNIKDILPIKIYQKFKNKAIKIYEDKEYGNTTKCISLILEKSHHTINHKKIKKNKHNISKIKKSKITISYHKSLPKKKYYGSKTRKKELPKYYESCKMDHEYYFNKHQKNNHQIHMHHIS